MRIANLVWLGLLAVVPASRPEAAGSARVTGTVVVVDKGKQVDPAKLAGDDEVYVYLVPVGHQPKTIAAASGHTIVHQKQEFRRHINVIPVGTTVAFPNNDTAEHNAFSNTARLGFDFKVYGHGEVKSRTFTAPGEIEVFCDIHENMWTIVKVIDSAWYGPVQNGAYAIDNVPPGRYKAVAWMRASKETHSQEFVVVEGQVATVPAFSLQRGKPRLTHQRKDGSAYPPYN